MNRSSYLLLTLLLAITYASAFALSPDKLPLCGACHGETGISPNPMWPHLAGQHERYLKKQLNDYKNQKLRQNPTMNALVATLDEQDIAALATYYSKQTLPAKQTTYTARGEELYRRGDLKKHIPACITCHGPQGYGNAQANFPLIAGQNPTYTISQLLAFKKSLRSNDLNHIMHDISQRLSKQDRQDVADYFASLGREKGKD